MVSDPTGDRECAAITGDDLDPSADVAELAAALVDIPSVSGTEAPIADAIERALRRLGHLDVARDGNVVLARTGGDKPRRVLLAGHLDTVPIADNVPSRLDGDRLYGCGTSDMKAGDAVMLRAAARCDARYELTFVFYDNEEVDAARNGLRRIAESRRDWLAADLAILLEPTNGLPEAGCQGTLRARVTARGVRAHSARSWLGDNAIHRAAEILRTLAEYRPRSVDIDGCMFAEGLNAVHIAGGVAGNIVPDECDVTVNFRFAPDRDVAGAAAHVRAVFAEFDTDIVDSASGALPRLTDPATAEFIASIGGIPTAKYGWTDVSRFAALGIPAINYGPGDPNVAHTTTEHASVSLIRRCDQALQQFLRA